MTLAYFLAPDPAVDAGFCPASAAGAPCSLSIDAAVLHLAGHLAM